MDFKKEVVKLLQTQIKLLESDILELIEVPPNPEMGDYAFPCFTLSKEMKKAPNMIAEELALKIKTSTIIKRLEAKGPYLNFFINKSIFSETTLKKIFQQKQSYGSGTAKKEKIMIEYPAPNTNKPLHLGHVRNMLLGKSLSNILDFSGYKVIQVNLNNDRGIHICKSMLAYKHWGNKKAPDKKSDHYVGDFYVLYAQKVKKDERLELEAYEMLQKWEKGNKEVRALWKKMNKWAMNGFDETYQKFGIKFDKVYNESEHYEEAKKIVLDALKKNIFEKDDSNNIIANLEKFNLSNKVVLREDGTSVYMTQDINLAKIKFNDFKMDRSIYIVGSEQNLHFKQLFTILDLLGFKNTKGLHHLSYGMISLPEGRMKSREGTVVDADNLIEEVTKLAREEIKKRHEIDEDELSKRASQIGMGALNFFILKYEPSKDFTFNPKESVSFEGETGPYVQYAHARISSILRKNKLDVTTNINFSLFKKESEQKLLTMLGNYPNVVAEAANNYKPSLIARFLTDLAQAFNEFYHECNILQEVENLKKSRLMLVYCIKEVLKNGLNLLAIKAPEQM
jgi:arginyl-tRNA synthetase